MSDWWTTPSTDASQISPEDLQAMKKAFFHTFYERPEGRQVYAYLRLIARQWNGTAEQVVALIDLMDLPRVFCQVGELDSVMAEAKVAQAASAPAATQQPTVPGYDPEAVAFKGEQQ